MSYDVIRHYTMLYYVIRCYSMFTYILMDIKKKHYNYIYTMTTIWLLLINFTTWISSTSFRALCALAASHLHLLRRHQGYEHIAPIAWELLMIPCGFQKHDKMHQCVQSFVCSTFCREHVHMSNHICNKNTQHAQAKQSKGQTLPEKSSNVNPNAGHNMHVHVRAIDARPVVVPWMGVAMKTERSPNTLVHRWQNRTTTRRKPRSSASKDLQTRISSRSQGYARAWSA